jgi:AraC family transcriptional regulator, regulatory protein of adaptative response / methylphosphotriester-DNA alkyltransferase methyltransferase
LLIAADPHRRLFMQAEAFIESHCGDPELSLTAVARALYVSDRQLQRIFRQVGQTSFSSYLERVRMERAATLLSSGASSREVATRVGYRHPAGFAKAFRRYYNCAPSAMRPPN